MKINKLDDIFRKKLEAYEEQPSDQAVEMMKGILLKRHRSLWIKRWLVAAGLLLFGTATIWMVDYLVKTEGSEVVVSGIEKTTSDLIENETFLDKNFDVQSDDNKTIISSEAVENVINNNEKAVIINKTDNVYKPMVKAVKSSEKPVEGKIHTDEQKGKEQIPVLTSNPVKDSEVTTEAERLTVDMQIGNVGQEIVPIKIVYKKTVDSGEQEQPEKRGLFREGYKKIAAVVDRMNIKDGAKEKLQKTREELLAMSPVRFLKKEKN